MTRSTPCSRTASSFAIRYVPPSPIGLRRSTAMSPPAGERCSVSPEAAGNATTAAVRPSYHHVPPSRMTSEPAAGTALMPTGAVSEDPDQHLVAVDRDDDAVEPP